MAGSPQVPELLEEMLDSGRTPEEVCGDCPELLPEVRARWQEFCRIDAEVGALLPGPEAIPNAVAMAPGPQPTDLPQVPGYEVEAVLGRGGMGVVYKARHLALRRTVALKMLAAGHADPADRARFRAEAEAVARLQHPNIVQIHEVGETAGRPFFALEFVQGGSLAGRLAGQALPPRDAARLVAALAEAMHLAHSRSLVHRDLKPGNVLLEGAADVPIGQCQPKVSDFGLARHLDADSGRTQVGVIMGTPSYMAPEQAEGRAHAAGPAADVYALGAILYECLTGRPPFKGATALETLEQVRTREPATLSRQVPRDLETICRKCLRKQPEQRYSSARELADDLARFARGEPVAARPVGAAESVYKWVRRRPTAAGLLVALVLLAAAGGVGSWLLYRQAADARARQARTDEEVRATLERARAELEEGWQAADLLRLTEAGAEGDRAGDVARSGGASAAVRQDVEAFEADARERLGRARKNRALLEALLDVSAPQETGAYARDGAGRLTVLAQPSVDGQYAAAFRARGLDVDGTAEADLVQRLTREPDLVVQELIAGLDEWMTERQRRGDARWQRLFRVADQLDRSERHRRLRALLVGGTPRAEGVAALVGSAAAWPALWELARGNVWRQLLDVRTEIDPRTEPVLTVVLLAQAFAEAGDVAQAEQVLGQAAIARPDQVVLLDRLGKLLEQQGPSRLHEVIGYYRAARGQRRHLGIALSKALLRVGRPAEAEEVVRELLRQQPDNPALWYHVGRALDARRNYAAEEAAYRKALDLKPDFAEVYNNLGNALLGLGKFGEMEAAYRKAVELKPDLAEAHYNLGCALDGRQQYGAAEAAYRRAVALKPDFAEARTNLGNALFRQRKLGEAEAAYRKAIEVNPDLVEARASLGNALVGRGMYEEAEAAYRKALDLRPDSAAVYNNLGYALMRRAKYGEAEAACRKAVDLKPDFAEALCNLGEALTGRGKNREAEAAFRKAVDLKPDYAEAHANLGSVLNARQCYGAAEAACRKAIAVNPGLAGAHTNLGIALVNQRRHAEAEAACRTALGLRPDLGEAHYYLGVALRRQARFDEAAAALKTAGGLLPPGHSLRERARLLRQESQRFADLDGRLAAILQGTEKPATAAEQIEFARLCHLKKRYAAAARLFRDALAAEPNLARNVPAATRYDAACAAALAGCARGEDANTLDDGQRALWRRQALDWLRQDLAWWGPVLDKGNARTKAQVRMWMRQWQADADLAGVRAGDALSRLPEEEREGWERLWSDVAALVERPGEPE